MALFRILQDNKLEPIREITFRIEKDLQKLIEANLSLVFGLQWVKSEFSIRNFRIDTLAFNPEDKSFVIIEYKRDKNFSVIDQGYAYLSLMLNNKSDFILEYNENNKRSLRREEVDWSQSKVIFVSPSFTRYQREAINFRDLPIELWEVKKYHNDTVFITKLSNGDNQESIKTLSVKNDTIARVSREIKVYTEQEHLKNASEEIREIYEQLKERILALDNINLQAKKVYLSFKSIKNIVDIQPQRRALKMWLNLRMGELNDSQGLARNVSQIGHHGNGDYELIVTPDTDLDYVMTLIKQSWMKNSQ